MSVKTEMYVIEGLLNNRCTNHPTDRVVQKMVIDYAMRNDLYAHAINCFFKARKEWMAYQTTTQRRWQKETRNPNKARHHDSISIREKYVRVRP